MCIEQIILYSNYGTARAEHKSHVTLAIVVRITKFINFDKINKFDT